METVPSSQSAPANAQAEGMRHGTLGVLRCAICERRLRGSIFWLEETGSDAPQSWMLCGACNAAVKAQMARTQVRTPHRLRVAIGLVAAERTPTARRHAFGQLSDTGWEKLLFWTFLLAMLAHLAVIVFVATLYR